MSQDESSSIAQENLTAAYGSIQRSSTVNFEHIRPSTPTLHRIDTAPFLSQSILSTTTNQSLSDQMVSTITPWTKFGYGLGHVYNDLCASVWFSYLLLFLKGALKIQGIYAGGLMMLGQIGDAAATPIVGMLIDKYGTKQKWHIFGTIIVFITFPMLFSLCPNCNVWPEWWTIVYFSVIILLFQVGWPIVQVSHLAIIPEVSRTQKDRTQLTSVRYTATVISSVIVYSLAWLVLRTDPSSTDEKIGPQDTYRFRDISLILTLIGLTMTAIFHFSLTFGGYELRRFQALLNRRASLESRSSYRHFSETLDAERPIIMRPPQHPQRRRKNFLKSAKIYQYSLLYVFARIFATTAMVYIPLWLDDRSYQIVHLTTGLRSDGGRQHLALVPAVSFVASFISSLIVDHCHIAGHKSLYLIGSILCMIGCLLIEMTSSIGITLVRLYSVASLFGAGSSITMIASLCLIANMIGKHADQSGFVYSAVTCADKLITGVAVLIIESLKCHNRSSCPEYYKNVLARACGGAAILGVLTLATLLFNRRRHSSRRQTT